MRVESTDLDPWMLHPKYPLSEAFVMEIHLKTAALVMLVGTSFKAMYGDERNANVSGGHHHHIIRHAAVMSQKFRVSRKHDAGLPDRFLTDGARYKGGNNSCKQKLECLQHVPVRRLSTCTIAGTEPHFLDDPEIKKLVVAVPTLHQAF
jgi:hypothetical protein